MMRSQRKPAKAPQAGLIDHPFLILAVIAVMSWAALAIGVLQIDGFLEGFFELVWKLSGFGFRWIEGVIEDLLPGLTGMLANLMTGLLGLLLHLLADSLWQRLRWMKR